jgi:hypothetical protein
MRRDTLGTLSSRRAHPLPAPPDLAGVPARLCRLQPDSGHVVDWYPYPFLDPGPRGYTGVIQSSIGIALTAAVLVYVLTLFTGQGSLLGRLRA